jgi:hypothetical protein
LAGFFMEWGPFQTNQLQPQLAPDDFCRALQSLDRGAAIVVVEQRTCARLLATVSAVGLSTKKGFPTRWHRGPYFFLMAVSHDSRSLDRFLDGG